MRKFLCYLILAAILLTGCSKTPAAEGPGSIQLPTGYSLRDGGDGSWILLYNGGSCAELRSYPLPEGSELGPDNYGLGLLEDLLRDLGIIPDGEVDRMLEGGAKGPAHLYIGEMVEGVFTTHDYDLILTEEELYVLEEVGDYSLEAVEALRDGLNKKN